MIFLSDSSILFMLSVIWSMLYIQYFIFLILFLISVVSISQSFNEII